ncbi:amastin-like protein [Leishmania donovani]|uniref:Amastin-like_protein n=3 Tax=Leishmania donovani species complex TaxID=38574 RepID=A0A6L0XQ17_LEIIN|nr:amastin-like protein [Leishmania infantum JPCM5]XP_003864267.1 amastin-like protein [Leishmania donovani]CAC9537200.1 amastin-like_protein [Leishmania infantum]AYU82442.1 amastin-like protein [Leishmania donovani]TPP40020.1 Amastin surface glycofamily protein [Leishmania donovani]TPP50427.1 Amastin surface glycofamily protein [Leishmania donovani]CAJ1992449.1 amastin-like protein [Leishmania donovani]|eukprot:XP_001468483.1 amastin-like protein [Leishmania infantum JPCM5]
MGCISGIIFGILQFVALLFIAVGTPLAMYMPLNDNALHIHNGYCISLWGIRDRCLILLYSVSPNDVWAECNGRVGRFKTAQVCAIAGAVILAASMLGSFLDACCCYCIKYVCVLLNLLAAALLAVSWGCMLDCYVHNQGSHIVGNVDVCTQMRNFTGVDNAHPEGMQLGAGFALLIAAFVISFVNIFVMFIPC